MNGQIPLYRQLRAEGHGEADATQRVVEEFGLAKDQIDQLCERLRRVAERDHPNNGGPFK
jgi:hypothetical protein